MLKSLNTLVVSLRSSQWRALSDKEKRDMHLNLADDGEFW